MQVVNVHDAKTNLSQLLQKVANGEEVIVGKAGKPVAKIVPFTDQNNKRLLGLFKGKIKMSADFTAEDPEINELFS